MVSLTVNFDRENKFYFEGEKLCASVELSSKEPVNVSSVLVYLMGECCCVSKRDPQLSTLKEREIYFNDVLPLFVPTDQKTSMYFEGTTPFSFEYQLPSSLPTSLESPEGYIRYSLHARAMIRDSIVKCMQYFTIVSRVDLKNNDAANLPVVMWKNENQCIFSLLCFRSGQIRVFVNILRKGFVPGEMLTINAEVWNFSRLPVSWVKAVLIQILRYNFTKVEKRRRVVAEVTRGCILPHDNQTWRSENLFIPAIPPTTIPAKGLINVKYKFYFMIKTSWQEKSLILKQNIIIGSLPVVKYKQMQEREQGKGECTVNVDYYQYSNLEPCIFGPHSIGDESSASLFSPLYPIYTEQYSF